MPCALPCYLIMPTNEQEISDMKKGIVEFLDETVEQLGISGMGEISTHVLKKQKKDDLSI